MSENDTEVDESFSLKLLFTLCTTSETKSHIPALQAIFTHTHNHDITLNGKDSIMRHIDLYRLGSVEDTYNIGLEEIVHDDGISFIEWGTKFIDLFHNYYLIDIKMTAEFERSYAIFK